MSTSRPADWAGHVIVCGLHDVSLRIVEELTQSGVPAVVIDDDPDHVLADYPFIPGFTASSSGVADVTRAS